MPGLIWYLLAINLVTFIAYFADKIKAIRGKWRIPERVLLGLAFIGGSVGALLGMFLCHHKVRKPKFMVGVPIFLLFQIALVYWVKCFLFH